MRDQKHRYRSRKKAAPRSKTAADKSSSENEGNSSDSIESEWEELEKEEPPSVKCLFCPKNFIDFAKALQHCIYDHKFDLQKLASVFKFDCYLYIKLINYIRKNKIDPGLIDLTNDTSWKSDEYLKMELADDPWILYGFDSMEWDSSNSNPSRKNSIDLDGEGNSTSGVSADEMILKLESTVKQLKIELSKKNHVLKLYQEDFQKMKSIMQCVLNEKETRESVSVCVKSIPVSSDCSYFDSYADFSIHREMLMDFVRTNTYKNAIKTNTDIIKGRTVLDLGCGTGILSMFAADAGASKVIAIDQSDIIYDAMEIIRDNGFSNKIELIKGRLEDSRLPVEKVDVLVSEWMGYFLLYEAMLDSVVYARDNHLIKGGTIIPNRFTLEIVGASDMDLYSKCVSLWSNCYGYKMSCIKKDLLLQPLISVIDSKCIVTNPSILLSLDMYECSIDSVNFAVDFNLPVICDCEITCLVGYFQAFFDLPNPFAFSTGPNATPTHWKQTVFLLAKPLHCLKGQILEGKLVCRRHPKKLRSLIINLSIQDLKQDYVIS